MDDQNAAKQDSERSDATLPPADVTKPLDSEATNPATAQQLAKVEQQMSGFEKATLRWAKSAVIMSGLAAVFVCAQWYEMHEGGVDTHALAKAAGDQAQAAQDMATAAGDQVDAGNNFADSAEEINRGIGKAVGQLQAAAENAKRGLDATQEAMRLDQRGWVTAQVISSSKLEPGKDFVIDVRYRNTGKTPARHTVANVWPEFVMKGHEPTYWTGGKHVISQVLMAPGTEYRQQVKPFQVTLEVVDTAIAMTAEQKETTKKSFLKQFTNGETILYAHGRIDYDDIFNCPHWTIYCAYLTFDRDEASMTFCPEHNETDENKCPATKSAKPN